MIDHRRPFRGAAAALFVTAILAPATAHAYIGPGAGFAFLGSSFVLVLTALLAAATLLFWPLQWIIRRIRGHGVRRSAETRRVVIVGLDGLEPKLLERYMAEGRLPHFSALKAEGAYSRLGTTLPALSPVAWSSFQTGVNPGAHNIFDFLTRDKRSCLPELASTELRPGQPRRFGPLNLGSTRPELRITRRSQPFWKILGRHGIFSNVIRVPISYPPEPFQGNLLSAMCTPDLRGTQGTFSLFVTGVGDTAAATGGERHLLEERSGVWHGLLTGPTRSDGTPSRLPFILVPEGEGARVEIGGKKVVLRLNEFSDWCEVEFPIGRNSAHGICRLCLRSLKPGITLYVSPINIHPEHPALPIAHPLLFSAYLAKRHGLYGTLGLMEDTWGRNELALDDRRFLEQAWLTHDERERMFFDALGKTSEGLCLCVFDASDRIQHMFWRYLDDQHPAPREDDSFMSVIPAMYERMDNLLGRVRAELTPDDVLIVLSDHGFASFRRCLHLNSWLHQEGYLAVKSGGVTGADYLQDVEWSQTRAFAVGLTGIYLNRVGRERHGVVEDGEVAALKAEIARKLEALRDPADGAQAVIKVYDSSAEYRGLYTEEAPDLIVGYAPGYRVSWDSVTGTIEAGLFSDNTKAWSGDHHVDPSRVPGILLTSRPLRGETPHIVDIAPTVLKLFSLPVPGYMEGRPIL